MNQVSGQKIKKFYYDFDNEDEFEDYEDAEDYWEEYH